MRYCVAVPDDPRFCFEPRPLRDVFFPDVMTARLRLRMRAPGAMKGG